MRNSQNPYEEVGLSDEDGAKLLGAGALAAAAAFGAYKMSKASGGGPWLYKLSPKYWTKSAAEKRYSDIAHQRAADDVRLKREQAAAEQAYRFNEAASMKEGRIAAIDTTLPQKTLPPPPEMTIPQGPPTAQGEPQMGNYVGEDKPGADLNVDKKVLGMLRKAGVPTTPGAVLSAESSGKLIEVTTQAFGGDREKAANWVKGYLDKLQITWYAPDGGIYGYRGGRKYMAAPPQPSTSGYFVGYFVGDASAPDAAPSVAKQASIIANAARLHGGRVAQIASRLGLGKKSTWTNSERDAIATGLLGSMMSATKGKPSAADAHMARQVVKVYGGSRGVVVAGEDIMGISFTDVINPISGLKAAWWGVKKVGAGAKWVGQKVGLVKGPSASPEQQHQAALIAAAKRKAAAAARIRAAEKQHEAAVVAQDEAQRIANAEADASDAEAAANEAEAIAIEAQAMQDVPDQATAALSGISGHSVENLGPLHVGFWSVVGEVSVPVGKAAIAAATPTTAGQKLRNGAAAARAVRSNPAAARKFAETKAKAGQGDKTAQQAVSQVRAGALADSQRTSALVRDAVAKRTHAGRFRQWLDSAVTFNAQGGWPGLKLGAPRQAITFSSVSGAHAHHHRRRRRKQKRTV